MQKCPIFFCKCIDNIAFLWYYNDVCGCENDTQIRKTFKSGDFPFFGKTAKLSFCWTDQNFGRIFGQKVLECILLNKSNKKNRAKCSKFGSKIGETCLTKAFRCGIMMIRAWSEFASNLVFLETSKSDPRSDVSPKLSRAVTPRAVYYRYPDSGWTQ